MVSLRRMDKPRVRFAYPGYGAQCRQAASETE